MESFSIKCSKCRAIHVVPKGLHLRCPECDSLVTVMSDGISGVAGLAERAPKNHGDSQDAFARIPSLAEHVIDELRALREPDRLLERLVEVAYDGGWSTIEISCESDEMEVYFSVDESEATGFAIEREPWQRLISHVKNRAHMKGAKGELLLHRQGKTCLIQLEVRLSQLWDVESGHSNSGQCFLHLPPAPKMELERSPPAPTMKRRPWWKLW